MDNAEEIAARIIKKLDNLASQHHDMSVSEAQEILDDYARVWIFLCNSTSYPGQYKPNSLLPRDKTKIEKAFAVAMQRANDDERRFALRLNYMYLVEWFINDDEAEKANMLSLEVHAEIKKRLPQR